MVDGNKQRVRIALCASDYVAIRAPNLHLKGGLCQVLFYKITKK